MTAARHSAPGKISAALEPEILALAGKGHSSRQIAEQLRRDHGLDLSHKAIVNFLARTRTERADVAKVVVREAVARTLTEDLDVLGKRIGQAAEFADRAAETKRLGDFAVAVGIEKGLIETRLKFSGASEPDSSEDDVRQSAERVLARVRDLAKAAQAPAPSAGDPPAPPDPSSTSPGPCPAPDASPPDEASDVGSSSGEASLLPSSESSDPEE